MTKVRFVPGSALMVSACVDARLRVWDSRTGSCVRTLTGHREDILDIDLSAYVLFLTDSVVFEVFVPDLARVCV